jgi:hypothetical protein
MRVRSRILLVLASIVLIPATTYAQGSIAGVVKDASGAVLPGVTVEASSPALIEQTRSVVTDGTGQYKIVDLRPGTYTVTFALPGFNTVKREGLELSGAFTATVNADLRVGAVEETITVTGETPIVDVQSTTRQQVLDHGVIDAVPTGRLVQNLGVLLPGVSVSGGLTLNGVGTQDVGGSSGNAVSQLASHGGRGLDQRTTMNGLSLMLSAGVNNTPYVPNMGSTQEVTIDTSGVSAEAAEGGVRVNVIPKEGGNTFRGLIFASFANESMQSSNFTDDLKARGFTTPNALKKVADLNPAFGGPILQNKLWFYASHRLQIAQNWVGGMFFDTTYNDPNVWTLNQDAAHRVSNDGMWNEGNVRLTWQATQRNKFGFSFAKEHMCTCPSAIPRDHIARVRQPLGMATPSAHDRMDVSRHLTAAARSRHVPPVPPVGLVPVRGHQSGCDRRARAIESDQLQAAPGGLRRSLATRFAVSGSRVLHHRRSRLQGGFQ